VTDPSRLAEFGDRLRQLRKDAGLTASKISQSTGWQPSKMSRIETGQAQISEPDLRKWARAVGVPDEGVEELLAELRAIRLDAARWRSRVRAAGHEGTQVSFGAAELAAETIAAFEIALVPGLLQTPAYARAVFTAAARLNDSDKDIDAAVAARMRRQEILYDESKRISMLVCEAALRSSVASAATMAGQLDRLVAASNIPHIRFGIVPLNRTLPFVPVHGFWLLDDVLFAEVLHTEVVSRDPTDVRMYVGFLDEMWSVAVEGDEARALLLEVLAELRSG